MLRKDKLITPIADEFDASKRLDKFLADCFPDISRSRIKQLIEQGCVSMEEETCTSASQKVKQDDMYEIEIPELEEGNPTPENIELDIVFEDDDIIVINKPAGMVVHPGAGNYTGTLVNALMHHCKDSLSGINGEKRPGIVHRIDKDTSGLIVSAKNDFAHNKLAEQFADHSIERTYYAVVWGMLTPTSGIIDSNIGRSKTNRKKMTNLEHGGKNAITHYKILKYFTKNATLVECKLETGRTHQIRVHMTQIGHPLIGDSVYGRKKNVTDKTISEDKRAYISEFPRQALHAKTLGFIHPRTNEYIFFDSKLPNDFNELISSLE